MPKSASIYIYGQIGHESHLTFFKGNDLLGETTRKILNDFFVEIDDEKLLQEAKEKLKKAYQEKTNELKTDNVFGLKPYIRKAFDYRKDFRSHVLILDDGDINESNLDFFNKERNEKWENNVIDMLKNIWYEE